MQPLRPGGKYLMVCPPREDGLIKFGLVGPKYGILATEFVTPATLRRVAHALLRFANEVEGKPNLRCLRGGKSRLSSER
jgi:hypothetical protein